MARMATAKAGSPGSNTVWPVLKPLVSFRKERVDGLAVPSTVISPRVYARSAEAGSRDAVGCCASAMPGRIIKKKKSAVLVVSIAKILES